MEIKTKQNDSLSSSFIETELDANGFIKSPLETEENWYQRVHALVNSNPEENYSDLLPPDLTPKKLNEKKVPALVLKKANALIKETFEIEIGWAPVFYEDQLLSLFAGARFISFDTINFIISLKEKFKDKNRWFIYNREELIAHEFVHASRVSFHSIVYEEILAYQVCKNKRIQFWGGIFHRPLESLIFIVLCFSYFISSVLNHFIESINDSLVYFAGASSIFYIFFQIVRHLFLMKRFKKSVRVLNKISNQPLAILLRCSDEEIHSISCQDPITVDALELIIKDPIRTNILKKRFIQ